MYRKLLSFLSAISAFATWFFKESTLAWIFDKVVRVVNPFEAHLIELGPPVIFAGICIWLLWKQPNIPQTKTAQKTDLSIPLKFSIVQILFTVGYAVSLIAFVIWGINSTRQEPAQNIETSSIKPDAPKALVPAQPQAKIIIKTANEKIPEKKKITSKNSSDDDNTILVDLGDNRKNEIIAISEPPAKDRTATVNQLNIFYKSLDKLLYEPLDNRDIFSMEFGKKVTNEIYMQASWIDENMGPEAKAKYLDVQNLVFEYVPRAVDQFHNSQILRLTRLKKNLHEMIESSKWDKQ